MRATDVQPTRLAASQAAAKAFVADQPSNVRIGVVSFAGTAAVVQMPTQNRDDIVAAIDRFQLQRATAIGSGIIVSLATLFPDAGIDVSSLLYGRNARRGLPFDQSNKSENPTFKPVPPGSYSSAAIILLTDGQRTTGPDSLEAAKMAADRGVRIFTVGFGTKGGETIGFEGWSMRVRLDEETLKAIASVTRGEYFYAGTANDLKKVYESLNARFLLEKKDMEISALFAAAAAVTALVSGVLSLLWFNRIL
jgi:Ca-activated chloride channel family protein